MRRTSFLTLSALALSASLLAQPGPGPRGPHNTPRPGTGVNMTAQQTFEGTISALQLAWGAQYPSATIGGKAIRLAPVWFFLENDFELSVSERVRITAAPSLATGDAYLYAVTIVKLDSGKTLNLRDAAGIPLWIGGGNGGRGNGPGNGNGNGNGLGNPSTGSCFDPSSIKTVSGAVESVTAAYGIQHPNLIVKTGDTLMTFVLGPERILLAAGFAIEKGETLTVKYAACPCDDDLLVLALTDASGNTLVLRNDDGSIAW